MRNNGKLVFLFDGSCNFCTFVTELLRVLDWRHHLHCIPFQAPGIPQAYGLTVEQCKQSAWAIFPDGNTFSGAQAISAAFDTLLGLHLFQFLYQVPGIGPIEEKVYNWVANHRQFLPGIRPYCERPGSPCST